MEKTITISETIPKEIIKAYEQLELCPVDGFKNKLQFSARKFINDNYGNSIVILREDFFTESNSENFDTEIGFIFTLKLN